MTVDDLLGIGQVHLLRPYHCGVGRVGHASLQAVLLVFGLVRPGDGHRQGAHTVWRNGLNVTLVFLRIS